MKEVIISFIIYVIYDAYIRKRDESVFLTKEDKASISADLSAINKQIAALEGRPLTDLSDIKSRLTALEGAGTQNVSYVIDVSDTEPTKASLNTTYGSLPAGTLVYFPNFPRGAKILTKLANGNNGDWDLQMISTTP